jgi:OOP family OmpA-OmpF porin
MLEFRPKRLLLCGLAAFAVTFVAVAFAREGDDGKQASRPASPVILAETAATADKTANKASESRPRAYVWSARRMGSTLMLRGFVPSEEDRRTVLGMVKAHFAELEVEDRLRVTDGAPPREQWLGAVSFGLKQLSHLKQGSARLLNDGLKVEGEARSGEDFAEVKKALAGPLPAGLVLLNDNIRPPVVNPFTFVAALSPNTLTLTGSVPSEDTRKQIKDWSRRYFERPTLDDQLQLASGAPKKWDSAVEASLKALSRLDTGKVSLSGVAITIEGVARDQGTAIAVSYQLRRDLPALFSSSESIRWKEAELSRTIGELILPRIKEAIHTEGALATGSILSGAQ